MIFPALLLDFKNLAIIFVAILHAALGIVIPLRGPVRRQNITYGLLEVSLVLWSVSMIFYRSSTGEEIFFWVKILYASALFIPYTFIYFLYTFPEEKIGRMSKWFHFLLSLPVLFLLWVIFRGYLAPGIARTVPEPTIIFTRRLEYIYAAYIVGYFSFSYYTKKLPHPLFSTSPRLPLANCPSPCKGEGKNRETHQTTTGFPVVVVGWFSRFLVLHPMGIPQNLH